MSSRRPERWLTPTSADHVRFIQGFGWLAPSVDGWTQQIADASFLDAMSLTELSFETIIQEILSVGVKAASRPAPMTPDEWGEFVFTLVGKPAATILSCLVSLVRDLFKPPRELKVQRAAFHNPNDPALRAEVTAVYEVDRPHRRVTFYALWYTGTAPVLTPYEVVR